MNSIIDQQRDNTDFNITPKKYIMGFDPILIDKAGNRVGITTILRDKDNIFQHIFIRPRRYGFTKMYKETVKYYTNLPNFLKPYLIEEKNGSSNPKI